MHLRNATVRIIAGAIGLVTAVATSAELSAASNELINRGEYLVNFGGCNDCHTQANEADRAGA